MSDVETFVYVLTAVRPGMLIERTPEEAAITEEHFEYIRSGLVGERLALVGRLLDPPGFGIVVFGARGRKEAEEFMSNDLAVKKGIMTAQLHKFRVALRG